MSRRRQLSDEEHALWAGFARSIKPLRSAKAAAKEAAKEAAKASADAGQDVSQDANQDANRAAHQKVRVSPQSPARSQPPPAVKSPPLAPFDRRFKQRVARGRDAIDARIDLHGMTQRQAHAALFRFLRGAQAEDAKVVLVVTGKGGGKPEPDARRARCAAAASATVARAAGISPRHCRLRRSACQSRRARRALCALAACAVAQNYRALHRLVNLNA